MDLASTIGTLIGQMAKAGAPALAAMLGTAIAGPAGTIVGGLAGTLAEKAVNELAKQLGVPATPEAVVVAIEGDKVSHDLSRYEAIQRAEAAAPELMALWQIEATRVSDAQTAEIQSGFGSWQFWRGAWQALIIGGWALILLSTIFGGNIGVRSLIPLSDVVSAWGSVTLTWLAVFNGGHTLKEIAPMIGFGRKAG